MNGWGSGYARVVWNRVGTCPLASRGGADLGARSQSIHAGIRTESAGENTKLRVSSCSRCIGSEDDWRDRLTQARNCRFSGGGQGDGRRGAPERERRTQERPDSHHATRERGLGGGHRGERRVVGDVPFYSTPLPPVAEVRFPALPSRVLPSPWPALPAPPPELPNPSGPVGSSPLLCRGRACVGDNP